VTNEVQTAAGSVSLIHGAAANLFAQFRRRMDTHGQIQDGKSGPPVTSDIKGKKPGQ
jgi:hypothetical protein